jgi:hypothetical protein
MKGYDTDKARLERALVKKGFHKSVSVSRLHGDSDGDFSLLFPDGRKGFGSYDELKAHIENATSVELLMATCDLDEQLSD